MYDKIGNFIRDIKNNNVYLDKQLALEYLGENEAIYDVLINNFLKEYRDSDLLFNKYLNKKDYTNLELLVHKFKGITLYLGSNDLYNFTDYLVKKIKNTNLNKDKNFVEEIKILSNIITILSKQLKK